MTKPSLRLSAVLLFAVLTAHASLTQQPAANREIAKKNFATAEQLLKELYGAETPHP